MSGCAIVFVRRTGAEGVGHVGWAFSWGDGTFSAGSVENPPHTLRTNPKDMGFWTIRTTDPIAPMRARRYSEFKVIDVDQENPAYAWQVVAWSSRQPYRVIGCNCMDCTYDVLRAYGVADLPAPAHHWEPNHWFNCVQGRLYQIDADDVALVSEGRRPVPLTDADSLLTDPPEDVEPAAPPWRIVSTPDWIELQAAMARAPRMPPPPDGEQRSERAGIVVKIRRLLGMDRAHTK